MNQISKRIIAVILTIYLLLSVTALTVCASDSKEVLTYTFGTGNSSVTLTEEQKNAANGYLFASTVPCRLLNHSQPSKNATVGKSYIQVAFDSNSPANGAWYAIEIDSVVAGTYDLTFKVGNASSGGLSKVYVLNADVYKRVIAEYNFEDNLTTAENTAFYGALYDGNGVLNAGYEGIIDSFKYDAFSEAQSIGDVTFAENGSYVLLFRSEGSSPNNTGNAKYQSSVKGLTMTSVEQASVTTAEGTVHYGSLVEALSAAKRGETVTLLKDVTTGTILIPDGVVLELNGFTLNATVDTGSGLKPVEPDVAVEDIIRTGTFSKAGTSVVNGHDYLYLFMKGKKLLVYDLDTKQKIDEEANAFGTPRGMAVDSKGIVWAVGGSRYLYRYDPYTLTGEQIAFTNSLFPVDSSFNALGITVDENDKIYFGTYNRGYLGMYDPESNTFTNLSGWLNTSETLAPDAMYAGFGGLVVKDGYIYAGIDGDKNGDLTTTHQIIKYSIAEQKIVEHVDISECWGVGGSYFGYLNLVGDKYLLAGSDSMLTKTIAVDIETMQLVEIEGMDVGYSGFVSGEIDGKVYCLGNTKMGDGMFEIDLETMVATQLSLEAFPADSTKLICWGSESLVTIEGDERLPGVSLATVRNNTENGTMEPVFYNIKTQQTVIWDAFTSGEGSGNQLRCLITSVDGKTIYLGAYGTNQLAVYDVESGTVLKQIRTYSTQIEGLLLYDGDLYAGNYDACGITKVDVENGTYTQLCKLDDGAFSQNRIHATASGDGLVFFGTAPSKNRLGGVLTWYDIDKDRVYVAAGPNAEDVYYTPAGNNSNTGWYSVLTGEPADLDDDNDGTDDADITLNVDSDGDGEFDKIQRFTGVIKNQSIDCMIYKDGYIYGCTTRAGGSGAMMVDENNACLFVYDVEKMELVATYDLCNSLNGLLTPVEIIDVIAQDPIVDNKFWGIVANTLFSFTFDHETKEFAVTEELCMSTDITEYKVTGNAWQSRDIIFDGDYMYAIFMNHGTYMIDRNSPETYYQLSAVVPKRMVMAADGNLYFHNNDAHLKVLRVAETTQPLVAESVQAMIDALPETVTVSDDEAVADIRKAYDALTEMAKALVDTSKLEAAEVVLAPSRAASVDALINAIGTVSLESGKVIRAARQAYDALLEAEKVLVTNLNVLTDAETQYADLKDQAAAEVVVEKIKAIGTVTLESESVIAIARAAYDALTDSQKVYVTNLNVLTAAEASLSALQNPKTGDSMLYLALVGILAFSAFVVTTLTVTGSKKSRV